MFNAATSTMWNLYQISKFPPNSKWPGDLHTRYWNESRIFRPKSYFCLHANWITFQDRIDHLSSSMSGTTWSLSVKLKSTHTRGGSMVTKTSRRSSAVRAKSNQRCGKYSTAAKILSAISSNCHIHSSALKTPSSRQLNGFELSWASVTEEYLDDHNLFVYLQFIPGKRPAALSWLCRVISQRWRINFHNSGEADDLRLSWVRLTRLSHCVPGGSSRRILYVFWWEENSARWVKCEMMDELSFIIIKWA